MVTRPTSAAAPAVNGPPPDQALLVQQPQALGLLVDVHGIVPQERQQPGQGPFAVRF
ncbi:hypothetical protein [Streptomyces sp. NPDC052496]|uniref:hypothetical protein n=1 Tax=Streptomyces sp. NPDC052496 TaxID=3154951 RepID=UPI0034176A8D